MHTKFDSPPLFSKNPDNPTIISPRIARPHPVKCLFSITIPARIFEKMAVVTIEVPLSIIKVDPEIKASPIYWSIEESASERAGIAKTHFL